MRPCSQRLARRAVRFQFPVRGVQHAVDKRHGFFVGIAAHQFQRPVDGHRGGRAGVHHFADGQARDIAGNTEDARTLREPDRVP